MFRLIFSLPHKLRLVKLSSTAELIRLSLINNTNDWRSENDCRLVHTPSSLQLWIGNEFRFLKPWDRYDDFEFSLIEKAVLWPLVNDAARLRKENISRAAWTRAMMGEEP